MDTSSEFHAIVISNADTELHSDNTLTKFTNLLPEEINFNPLDKWSVALESCSFDNSFPNFKLDPPHSHLIKILKSVNNPFEIANISLNRTYYSPTSLCKDIMDQLKQEELYALEKGWEITGKPENFNLDTYEYIYLKFFEIVYDHKFKKFLIKGDDVVVEIRTDLAYLCRFRAEEVVYKSPKNNREYVVYNFKRREQKILRSYENIVEFPTTYPKLIKVYMKEIVYHMDNLKYNKTLAILPMPITTKTEKYTYTEVEQKVFIPLISKNLKEISITLEDENDERLGLELGQSTFIKLHFKKMNEQSELIRVNSRPTDCYPRNTSSRFTINLPKILDFGHDSWEIALQSINIPNELNIINEGNKEKFRMTLYLNDQVYDMQLNNFDFRTQDYNVFIIYLNALISNNVRDINWVNACKFILNENGEVSLSTTKVLKMIISADLIYLLNGTHYKDFEIISSSEKPTITHLGNHIDWKKLLPHSVLLYLDCIKPHIVGSQYLRMLHFVPLEQTPKYEGLYNYSVTHLNFCPIDKNILTKFQFELRKTNGELIDISNGNTFVNLILRKKKLK